MLKVEHLYKTINNKPILSDVDFQMPLGSITGLVGENGAGKTTLLRLLVGILKPTSGQSTFLNKDIYHEPQSRENIVFISEEMEFFKYSRFKDLINFYQSIYPNFDENYCHQLNKKFKIPLNTKIQKLSKGMRMKVSIMLGIASKPKLLLLDEPTTGLDPQSRKDLFSILINMVSEQNMSVIISSHLLHDLENICDHIIMLKEGKIVNYESLDAIKDSLKQIQVCFSSTIPEDLVSHPDIIKLKTIGRVAYITITGTNDKFIKELENMDILFWEPVGMQLEDIFITTNEIMSSQYKSTQGGENNE